MVVSGAVTSGYRPCGKHSYNRGPLLLTQTFQLQDHFRLLAGCDFHFFG